jgi:cytochrome c-type biogenesis protein CcmH/NrfF
MSNASEIFDTVMSPYCPGLTLSACPSDKARELRSEIEQWVGQGETKTMIVQKLSARYGEEIYGTPQMEGFGLIGWFAPALFIFLALLLLFSLRKNLIKVENKGREQ